MVTIFTSTSLREQTTTRVVAEQIFSALDSLGMPHKEIPTNNIWCRDYMPLLLDRHQPRYTRYRYYPDYLRDSKTYCSTIVDTETLCVGWHNVVTHWPNLIMDGGNYVLCDNHVIMTDKVLTENAGYCQTTILRSLEQGFWNKHLILLPWDMSEPYGHADGMVAYLGDNKLLLNNYGQLHETGDQAFRKRLLHLLEPHFEVIELDYGGKPHKDSWCYLNYLQVPGAVLLPCLSKHFDSDSDRAAIETFQTIFTEPIIPIYAAPLVRQGGALHCVTWEYYNN